MPSSRLVCLVICTIPSCADLPGVDFTHWAGRSIRIKKLERITFDPAVMVGRSCILGLRVTVGTLVGLLAAGKSREDILRPHPDLEPADFDEARAYAAWRSEEAELFLK